MSMFCRHHGAPYWCPLMSGCPTDTCRYTPTPPTDLVLDNVDLVLDNVTQFTKPKAVAVEFAPSVELIAICEQLLAQAKDGTLRGLGWATVEHDGLTASGSILQCFNAVPGCAFALGESIARLRHAWDVHRDSERIA